MNVQFDLKSILAGIMIGLGSIVYCVTFSLSTILGSFLFSLGLISVIIQQHNLYTGKIAFVEFNWKSILSMIRIIIGNVIGVYLICLCVSYTRMDLSLTEAANTIMSVKINDSLLSLFCLGIGCGIMMYLAVSACSEDINKKMPKNPLYVVLPVMFFIMCCFEHCIADVGYFMLSDVPLSLDIFNKFLAIVAGNTVGSIIMYRFNFI